MDKSNYQLIMKKLLFLLLVLCSCSKEKEQSLQSHQQQTNPLIGFYRQLRYCYQDQGKFTCIDQSDQPDIEFTNTHLVIELPNNQIDSLKYEYDGACYYLINNGNSIKLYGDTLYIYGSSSHNEYLKL